VPKSLSNTGRPKFLSRALGIAHVVPAVPLEGVDQPPERGETQAYVRVLRQRDECDRDGDARERAARGAEQEQRQPRARLGEAGIERMLATRREPVHLLDARRRRS
jgi:hypothetical protein